MAAAARQPHRRAARSRQREQLGDAFAGQRHGQLLAVGRPGRGAVRAAEIGQHAARAGGHVLHPDHGLLRLERHIGQLPAVGRPGRGDDGFVAGQGHLHAFAVGVGDVQREAAAHLQHIGDARRVHALLARQHALDVIGDAVRGQAHVGRQHQLALAHQLLVAHRVPELEAHVEAAIGQAADRARHQRVGTLGLPVGQADGAAFVQRDIGREGAEDATAFEVVADDLGHGLGGRSLVAEGRHGHRHLRGADTRDVDAELGAGGRGVEHCGQSRRARQPEGGQSGQRRSARGQGRLQNVAVQNLFIGAIVGSAPEHPPRTPIIRSPAFGSPRSCPHSCSA